MYNLIGSILLQKRFSYLVMVPRPFTKFSFSTDNLNLEMSVIVGY